MSCQEGEEGAATPKALCPSSCSQQELDALQQVWEITRDWEESWNQWKTGRFLTLQTEAMETMAHGLFRRLTRLAKEYKVHGTGWETRWPCPSLEKWAVPVPWVF